MTRRKTVLWLTAILAVTGGCCVEKQKERTISVVVVTGGHGFDKEPFARMFEEMAGIRPKLLELTNDSELFEDISNWNYDVIVFYNMTQDISAKRRENFLALLDRGVGVVALHHSLCSFQDWPEYKKIIGARYYLDETVENGTVWPASTYQHDVRMPVTIADKHHAVTAGVDDFTILDETYKGYAPEADNHVLLTVEEPTSQKEVGWTRVYRQSRVCTIQLGHGPDAYNHPSYRKLVQQAIQWTAGDRKQRI